MLSTGMMARARILVFLLVSTKEYTSVELNFILNIDALPLYPQYPSHCRYCGASQFYTVTCYHTFNKSATCWQLLSNNEVLAKLGGKIWTQDTMSRTSDWILVDTSFPQRRKNIRFWRDIFHESVSNIPLGPKNRETKSESTERLSFPSFLTFESLTLHTIIPRE